jgi:hypothetical protein
LAGGGHFDQVAEPEPNQALPIVTTPEAALTMCLNLRGKPRRASQYELSELLMLS